METPESTGLQMWRDKLELAELLAVLSSAVDRRDAERVGACYAPESFDDHGTFKGSGSEFAAFIGGPGAMSTMHHQLGQSVFEIQGDEAWGETFFTFHGAIGAERLTGYGRYVDYFKRIDGSWKLVYRRVVPDAVPDDLAAYWTSRRDRSDPSYDRRRWPDDGPATR